MSGFHYLGSPYSQFPGGLDAANTAVCIEAALLIRAGVSVYSPIAHMHAIALAGDIDPRDHELWMAVDRPLMGAAVGLIVLKIGGWLQSRGLVHEIDVFRAAGKPIVFMEPGTVPLELLREAA